MSANSFSFKEIDSITQDFYPKPPLFLKASDGNALAYYKFANDACRKVVILYAGAGLYGNKIYQWVAQTLYNDYNIGCYIFDIRGHGNSDGKRGDASSVQRVWEDVAEAVEHVKSFHKSANIYLAGHSSGAGLIINYAAHMENKIEDGYIFLAPYLGYKSGIAREHKNAEKSFISKVKVWVYVVGSLFPRSFITHFKALFFNYSDYITQDSLIVSSYSYVMACATMPYEINELLKKINRPVALFIGENDEQFLPEKVIAYQNAMNVSCQAKIVENAAHMSLLIQTPSLIADYIESCS